MENMESLRIKINDEAEEHYEMLKRVEPQLHSLFPCKQQKRVHGVPFGSFANGTFTGHSDIDVYIPHRYFLPLLLDPYTYHLHVSHSPNHLSTN